MQTPAQAKQIRYQLVKILGKGAMGTVYLGKDIQTHEQVAIKKLILKHESGDSESILRFKKEAEVISKFSHPHIIKMLNLVERDNTLYLVMEYFEGKDLKRSLKEYSLLDKVSILQKIAETLSYIHDKEIIHRDIKPENILVKKNGSIDVKIIDFGLAYLNDFSEVAKGGSIVGSFAYISPEQTGFLRRSIDNRSDLYSLGATFFELLTGRPPFLENDIGKLIHKHLSGRPPKPSSLLPDVPPILDEIILKLLSKEPEERYQTARGLSEDLKTFLANPDGQNFQIGLKDKVVKLNFQIKMIGRENELTMLKDSFQKVKKGEVQSLLLSGASGTGKSKLAETFREEIIDETTSFFTFKCEKAMMNIPYAAFSGLIKEYFEKSYTPEHQDIILKALGNDKKLLYSLFPFIPAFLGDKAKLNQSGESDKNKIYEVFLTFLKTIGNLGQNLVFFIDDIHWADQDSIELFSHVFQQLKTARILLLASAREDEQENPGLKKLADTLPVLAIKPLSKTHIPLFIHKMIGAAAGLSTKVYDHVYASTLGNPFFILEMVKALYESDILYNERYQWKVQEKLLESFEFEQDVTKLLKKRLESFNEPNEVRVLSVASIIGKEFSLDLLHELISYQLEMENQNEVIEMSDIINVIDKARSRQLIRSETIKGKGVYSFIHDKLLEILGQLLSPKESKDLHLIAARTLEKKHAANLESEVYQIAYHYNQTDDVAKMLYFNEMAYKKAISQFSLSETVYYMEKNLNYFIENNILTPQQLKLALELSPHANNLGKGKDVIAYLEKMIPVAKEHNLQQDEMNLYLGIGNSFYYQGDLLAAGKYYSQAMNLAKENNIEVTNPYPYRLLGSSYFFGYDMKMARYNFEKAIQYLPENDWENLVGVYGLLGWTNTFYGDMEIVNNSIKIIEENIVKIKNPLLQSQAYHVTAVCYSLGHINPKKAVEYSLKSYALAEKSNYTLFMYSSLASRMWGYYYQGNLEKALEAIDFALELAQKNNIFVGISLYYAYQVEILFARKDFQKSYDKAMEYLSDPKIQNDKFPALVMMRVQALYFYQQNYLDEALTVLNNAIALAESTSIAYIGITLQELKAKVMEKMGQNPAPALARIKDYRSKHKGIDIISENFKPMIALAEKTVAEKTSTFDSRASYTGSATVIKERLQLGNIIRTSQAISSILEIDELLHMVMEKTAEVTGAERGALLLVNDETGDLEYKVLHNPDDEGEEPLKISKSLIEKVKATKKGLVMTSLGEQDSTLSMTVVTEKIKSIIAAPLLVKDKLIGLLYMDSKLLNDLFSEDDLELLNVFTSQAAISIENARLHEKMLEKARLEQEMQIAKDIQTSILPFVKDTEHYEIAAFMRTATEVGGDYYDLFLKDLPHFGVFGDVSGHGLKSGLVMMMAEVAFNTIMTDEQMRNQELAGLYQKINYTLYENIQERLSQKSMIGRQYSSMYMTFRMFRFDHEGNFEIFGNDHAEPIICRQDSGEISTIPSTGFLLGIMEDAILDNQTHKFKLNSGDLLIFCSDGIAEGHKEPKQGGSSDHHREEFGEERINAIIEANRKKAPNEIIEAIVAGLDSYIHAQEDDVTLLVIKKK